MNDTGTHGMHWHLHRIPPRCACAAAPSYGWNEGNRLLLHVLWGWHRMHTTWRTEAVHWYDRNTWLINHDEPWLLLRHLGDDRGKRRGWRTTFLGDDWWYDRLYRIWLEARWQAPYLLRLRHLRSSNMLRCRHLRASKMMRCRHLRTRSKLWLGHLRTRRAIRRA